MLSGLVATANGCVSAAGAPVAPPTSAGPAPATVPSRQESELGGVSFTVTGNSFRPAIEMSGDSAIDVLWLDENGVELASGVRPIIKFPTQMTRVVTLHTALERVVSLNLGFGVNDDAGRYSPGQKYEKQPESVVGVSGLTSLPNLRLFLAANTSLSGELILSGLERLEFVECFKTQLRYIDLTGCLSLIRLCLEGNQLTQLDLNPVAHTLRDLRAASQQTGSLSLTPLTRPLTQLYHFCVRDQVLAGHPSREHLPVCEELWTWGCSLAGELRPPKSVRSLASAGNSYTAADLSGLWSVSGGELDLSGNKLTTLNLSDCIGLGSIKLDGNPLTQHAVSDLLRVVDSWGTEGDLLSLTTADNTRPNSSDVRRAEALRGRGWTVTINGG